MALAVGNIVTVISQETYFFEKQGEVVEIIEGDGDPDGPIGVKFGKECKHLFMAFHDGDQSTVRFLEAELRVDIEWNLATRVYRAYSGVMPLRVFTLKEPFDKTKACGTKYCSHLADRRCLINIWGSVYEIDLCAECAPEYDGMLGEMLPEKPLSRVA